MSRPILRYYGGKWLIAKWIVRHFPYHRIYVEPFGGAASVLLQKPRSYAEVYNDIDSEVVNVFSVLRSKGKELIRRIELTPFSRDEFLLAYQPTRSSVERARRTIVKTFLGFGSDSIWRKSGFRSNCSRSGTTPATDWRNFPSSLPENIDRLRGVVIENRPAFKVIEMYDGPDTLFYIDPPYVHKTRAGGERYRYEMDEENHKKLLKILVKVKGKVVISGYENPLYNKILKGWRKDRKKVLAQYVVKGKNSGRIEILWMNFESDEGLFEKK